MDIKGHLQNLAKSNYNYRAPNLDGSLRVSANKAIDFLLGDIEKHHIALMTNPKSGIKDWAEKGGLSVYTNLVKDVINNSALTFKKIPGIEVQTGGSTNTAATDAFNSILYNADAWESLKNNDKITRLLQMGNVLVWYEQDIKKWTFSLLHRGNFDVEYNSLKKEFISLLYETNSYSRSGAPTYRYITPDKVIDFEAHNAGEMLNAVEFENPYGFIPLVSFYDTSTPLSGFWPKGEPWSDLVRLNEALNVMDSTMVLSARWGILKILFTNMRIAEDSSFSAGSIVELESNPMSNTDPFAEFKGPDTNVEPFYAAIDRLIERLYNSYSVKMKVAGRATATSGFQLVVEEFSNLEMQLQRQGYATTGMKKIFLTMARMDNEANHGYGLPVDGELYISWPKPSLPVDDKEQWGIAKEKMAAGVMSRVEYLMTQDPTLTEEEAKAKIAQIDADKQASMATSGIKSNLQAAFGVADSQAA